MIRSQGLAYRYANGTSLTFPDVDVSQGSVLLLSGPSGSGKSTWLALVAGLVRPTSGQLTVRGQLLNDLDPVATDAWRASTIGFLPQKLHLSAALTVRQNLALAQWASGLAEDQAAIDAALAALGVHELASRKPAQLSGGQAQRVALARAVLHKPKVMLADEPSASLDDEAAASSVGLLLSTARAHAATLVIASHDARIVALLATDHAAPVGVQRLQLMPHSS
ncbi:MAG: ATP-binding cassette domain-containing protein [Rhodoferax sp.]|jgi:putative ABC transport system ATP-binding protein|nr:ATP-binding cassette domain-containing protein [Rhodoferax sp.]